MYKYIFSLGVLLGLLAAAPTGQAKTRWLPTGIQLGGDILHPVYHTWYQQTGTQYVWNASTDLAKLIVEADYGGGSIRWKGKDRSTQTTSVYTSEGRYVRIGLHYNWLRDTPDKNAAFLGVRYAMSFFDDHLQSQVTYKAKGHNTTLPTLVTVQEEEQVDEQGKVRAHWWEAVAGVRVKAWKMVYVGCTVSYKFRLRMDHAPTYVPYDILGWGQHAREAFGCNYYVALRIPLAREGSATPPE